MIYKDGKAEGIKIAYIGGGSRGWAHTLMSDLATTDIMNGEIRLYDIDHEAARANEIIGNRIKDLPRCRSVWNYVAVDSLREALTGADFVIISIMPATFDEMESDVHTPEKYGIYQSVGDTTGPGGILRAMRSIPMFREIAAAVRDYCPDAWVINYTNPMTVCTWTLYREFPKIKAFGCCHEVFQMQRILMKALEDVTGIRADRREDIKTTVTGVNHFTWMTDVRYKNMDLYPVYDEFVRKYGDEGYLIGKDEGWENNFFDSAEMVKMNLFRRFGVIAAAGDRHLAEFCGPYYLSSPEVVRKWKFLLTPVSFRKKELADRLVRSRKLVAGEEDFIIWRSGEEGIDQIAAILGLRELVTNVNLPNVGQVADLPLGAVVETNAVFTSGTVTPVMAGAMPESIRPHVSRISEIQRTIVEAGFTCDRELAFEAFMLDPLVQLPMEDARLLFDEMCENTKEYLKMYY